MDDSLNVVEICAGAGGQAVGLHHPGFTHRIAIQSDPTAAATLAKNLMRLSGEGSERAVVVGDVTDPQVWNPDEYAGVDLLAGGPPCPPFSNAGRRLGAADDPDLYAWSIGLTATLRPRAVLENVKGLAGPRFAGYRQAAADHLARLDYVAEWRTVRAMRPTMRTGRGR